jgi:hypothetical protein
MNSNSNVGEGGNANVTSVTGNDVAKLDHEISDVEIKRAVKEIAALEVSTETGGYIPLSPLLTQIDPAFDHGAFEGALVPSQLSNEGGNEGPVSRLEYNALRVALHLLSDLLVNDGIDGAREARENVVNLIYRAEASNLGGVDGYGSDAKPGEGDVTTTAATTVDDAPAAPVTIPG